MRFRFCGDLDCPDWVLAEINTLSKMVRFILFLLCAIYSQLYLMYEINTFLQSSVRLRILVSQIIGYCLVGELNYEKVFESIYQYLLKTRHS